MERHKKQTEDKLKTQLNKRNLTETMLESEEKWEEIKHMIETIMKEKESEERRLQMAQSNQ